MGRHVFESEGPCYRPHRKYRCSLPHIEHTDLNTGFWGLALIQSPIYNPEKQHEKNSCQVPGTIRHHLRAHCSLIFQTETWQFVRLFVVTGLDDLNDMVPIKGYEGAMKILNFEIKGRGLQPSPCSFFQVSKLSISSGGRPFH